MGTKLEKLPPRVKKESLHCSMCDVYVNSDNQMKQHLSSLRHKNTVEGIPIPPKPGRDEKVKPKSEQYRCNICKVTQNSDSISIDTFVEVGSITSRCLVSSNTNCRGSS